MPRTKRKTTIAFDPDNFAKLQNIAAIQNRSVTEILNELIEGYVQGKLPEGYEERIKDKVFALVDQRVESDYLDALAQKVAALLSSEKSTADTARTAKKKTDYEISEEDERAANIAKFKWHKASANKRSYNDQYVASQLGIAKETVKKYREGIRSPKQNFIDTWGLNWNGKQWIKN